MGGDSLGDGPYGIALIYRADCNLNQAHGAQFAAWAARVAAYERLADYAADGTGSGQTAATAASAAAKSKRAGS